jgi:hypothetical protein
VVVPTTGTTKNTTVLAPILCPPPRLGPEHGIISTLVAEYLLATALLFVPTLLLARRSEVASLADVLSGR